MTTLLILQFVIPLVLLGWLGFARTSTRATWALKAVLVGGYLTAVALAGVWLALPLHLPAVWFVLYAVALFRSRDGRRAARAWPEGARGWAGFTVVALLTLSAAALAIATLTGRRPPDGTIVDLAFPLGGGTYYVANGGSNQLMNPHLMTLTGERFGAWRGQSYGVDLVRLNAWGFRARGLKPRDPTRYAIFGDPVRAPCSGRVVQALDGLADLPPPQKDREHMAGNHVLLACGDVEVLLGHFQQGSVRVREGEMVDAGQEVGRVGNTGNTDEPHLHIHAQRPGPPDAPLGGDPLPVRLGGRYLARNALVRGG
jgi:hypothetical protein